MAALLALAAATACDEGGDTGGSPARGPEAAADTPAAAAAGQQRDTAAGGDTTPAAGRGGGLTVIDVAGHEVRIEVADDEAERRRGLMHRDSLPEDQGMLFVYPDERTLSFYMRNTRIPLDIAYIDRRGYIVDVKQMDPFTEELHPSSRPAMYALEMNQGWFEAHGVGEGDRIRF